MQLNQVSQVKKLLLSLQSYTSGADHSDISLNSIPPVTRVQVRSREEDVLQKHFHDAVPPCQPRRYIIRKHTCCKLLLCVICFDSKKGNDINPSKDHRVTVFACHSQALNENYQLYSCLLSL